MAAKEEIAHGKKAHRIFHDLMIYLVSTVIVASLLTVCLIYWYLHRKTDDDLACTAETYLTHLEDSLKGPIWRLNTETVAQIADSYMNTKLVARLKIVETMSNRVIYERQKPDEKKLLEVEGIVKHGHNEIARINLGLTRRVAQKEGLRTLQAAVVLIGVIVLVMVSVIMVFIRFLLKAPLQDLLDGIEQIAAGRYDYHFKTLRHVEFRSITEKFKHMAGRIKDREASLQQTEAKYRQLADLLPQTIFETDTKGRLTYTNQLGFQTFGYTQDNFNAGLTALDMLVPEQRDRAWANIERILAGEDLPEEEYTALRKDGTTFDAIIYANRIRSGGETLGLRGIIVDISDRKQAEDALLKSEKSYRELINNITDFIYSHDLAGRFTMVNRAVTKILGYIPEDLIGHPVSDFMLPEHLQAFKEEYLAQIKEKGSFGGLSIYLAKDGSKHYIEYRNVLVKQEGMEPFISGSGRDITEKVLSDRKVHRLEEQLQRAQKMEAIGTLAGGVAHDLNNVLSGIVSYPELLLLDIPEDSPLRTPILTIQKSGKKAADIVQDLLTLARRGVIATDVVNLNQIIDSYLKSPECENLKEFYPDAKIESDLEMNLLNIMGSPVHLSKSVMNLVNNAAEAMPDGGNIFISTQSRYIDKPLRGYDDVEEGDYVILTVSDTGMGISSEDMERIFEPFYTKKVMGRSGTGLGMAVVWGTVKDHRGYIDVQSTEGKETTFTLYFPVTRKEIGGKEEDLPMEEYMGKGESILVVDDVEEQREIASRILNKLSYSVTSVSSGEEAVDYMKDNSVDLLVLDMIMDPGIDGLETYKRVLELHPGQKAIIASGYSETDRVKEAQRLGAGKYIKKPYTLEKIGLAVKEELGK